MTIEVSLKTTPENVQQASERAALKNFGHAAARVRKQAMARIVTTDMPGPPGAPLRTKRGALRRAHRYKATKEGAVIGTLASRFGTAASIQFGGRYRGQNYPARPVIVPALLETLGDFHRDWRASF